ncbi:MAG TPA: hypothetical protein VH062_02005 [Polyangiaceae bacterium]|nr:hypothetical protein [Polyangiaceae bacterium]
MATLIGVPYEGVPHFVELAGPDAWLALLWWCEWQGLVFEWDSDDPGVPCIAKGPSPRDPAARTHAVIWSSGGVVFDPHASRDGLAGAPSMFALIRPKEAQPRGEGADCPPCDASADPFEEAKEP